MGEWEASEHVDLPFQGVRVQALYAQLGSQCSGVSRL